MTTCRNLLYFAFVNIAISSVFSRSEINLTLDASDSPVLLGQFVTLRCTISSRFVHETNLSVLFRRKDAMMAENCKSYFEDMYEVTCEPEGRNTTSSTRTYLFHIKSVSWMDRGKWMCLLSGSSAEIYLEVNVPPKVAPIEVSRITLPTAGALSSAHGSGSLALGDSSYTEPTSHPPHIYGLGTRTNPYDLRSGVELHLICQTECGYPKAIPEWTVNNMTEVQPRKLETKRNVLTQACEGKPETLHMTKSTLTLKLHCETFRLTGINKLRCALAGSTEAAASKHIYILCPGGEIEMTLTGGEMIGIGVASIALFSLFITGCVLLRARSRESGLIAASHSRAEAL